VKDRFRPENASGTPAETVLDQLLESLRPAH